jgi:hypothetical protein
MLPVPQMLAMLLMKLPAERTASEPAVLSTAAFATDYMLLHKAAAVAAQQAAGRCLPAAFQPETDP